MKHKKKIILLTSGLFLAFLFLKFPAPADRIINIQNYLITVGGIISAFVISYLSAKIFNIRAERENRQIEIDKYSDTITNFRRLIFYIMKSREFWVHYDNIAVLRKKYSDVTYEMYHSQQFSYEQVIAINKDNGLSSSTVDLYLAMFAIYGNPDLQIGSSWSLDKSASFNYTIEELIKFYEPSNAIWYYLDGRFAKHGIGDFTDTGINPLWAKHVEDLLPKINTKYKGKGFHRTIIAEIGSECYEIIPKLISLTKRNTGVPNILIKSFYSLLAIMGFGVVLPIIVQSISICNSLNIFLTLSCVLATVLAITTFLLDFLDFLNEDVHIIKNKQN